MAIINEEKPGWEIGKQGKNGGSANKKFVWLPCSHCGKARWVSKFNPPKHQVCASCAKKEQGLTLRGAKHGNWRGGRHKQQQGYILVWLSPDSFFFPMAEKSGSRTGYVFEHRLVMAQHLGRCLQPWELVHHKGTKYPRGSIENKSDNRFENLELSTVADHNHEHDKGYTDGYRQGYKDGQSEAIKELKAEIRLLRWQLKERQMV